MNYSGKTALVTGVGHNIGRAVALGLAEGGANLVLIDKNAETLRETAQMAAERGAQVLEIALDIADEAAVRAAVQQGVDRFGRIDILVNNAGIYTSSDFLKSTSADWKKYIDINILGTMVPTHAVLPHMLEHGYGRIINVGSVAGVYGISYFVDYSMTKGAVISFTKALAKAVTAKGITVNCVSPGTISPQERKTDYCCAGRYGTPEECASIILFLASDEARYISGQNYLVDGCRRMI